MAKTMHPFYRNWTLNEWTSMFDEIYKKRNLSLSRDEILHRLIEETAELVRPVLVFKKDEIEKCLPDIFAWVFAFANRCKIDLDRVLTRYIKKPPGKDERFGRTIKPLVKSIIGRDEPESMEDWQHFLGFIYRSENENISPELMISRLIEDLGKASRHLRIKENSTILEEELAGVLGWTIALANKFDIKIDDALYGKYPNTCHKCGKRPCRCFLLSTFFISYTTDTKDVMLAVKKLIENRLGLDVEVFEKLGPHFDRLRMVEAFEAIDKSDAAVVLMKDRYSENVRAESIYILKELEPANVLICVNGKKDQKEKRLQDMLSEIECFHQIKYYSKKSELLDYIASQTRKRLEELKKIKRKGKRKT